MMTTIPPYLEKGDTIGITCPAGYMLTEKAQTCITTLQQWGYQVMVGKTLGSNSANYFSDTDANRKDEMQAMLDDKNIKAILCGRGGYGVGRIIDALNFIKFKKNPKWIIGFSDITVLHSHVFSNFAIATLHAPMAAAFNEDGFKNQYILSLQKALAGKKGNFKCANSVHNKKGKAAGVLVGGNLNLLANQIGTPSDFNTKNKILFIEDIGEQLYAIDRMLRQLKRSGKLKYLKALIVGSFSDTKNTDRPFGKTLEEIIVEVVADYKYPVCFNFPVGHDIENVALKIGVQYQLNITNKQTTLIEL
jgi:muramoyltetrapeptide carboxypeptidase